MDTQLKGITANLFRDDYSCHINKYANVKRVVVVDEKLDTVFEASEEMPAVRLVRRNMFGREYIHAEPWEAGNYAFGGSFVYTSDSRLREINAYPIPLHDRQMNLESNKYYH